MAGKSDPQRRPVLYDLKNQRFLADPLIGGSYYPISGGGGGGGDGDQTIALINTATSAVILAARVTAGSTAGPGVLQLVDSVASTSVTEAATPNSVKQAYDTANSALPRSGGTMGGDINLDAGVQLVFEGSTANAFETALDVVDPTADRLVRLPDGSGTVALLELDQTWGGAQAGAITTLSSAPVVTINLAASNHFRLVLGDNVTLDGPINAAPGQSGVVELVQASSGGPYTVSYSAAWDFGGAAPNVSTTAGSLNALLYYVSTTGTVVAELRAGS